MNVLRFCKNICHVTARGQAGELVRCIILVRVRDDVIARPNKRVNWSHNARERVRQHGVLSRLKGLLELWIGCQLEKLYRIYIFFLLLLLEDCKIE